jgi:hypothetical protein
MNKVQVIPYLAAVEFRRDKGGTKLLYFYVKNTDIHHYGQKFFMNGNRVSSEGSRVCYVSHI